MGEMDEERCDLCGLRVDFCGCVRCFGCEELFPETEDDEGWGEDEDGEALCPSCAAG